MTQSVAKPALSFFSAKPKVGFTIGLRVNYLDKVLFFCRPCLKYLHMWGGLDIGRLLTVPTLD